MSFHHATQAPQRAAALLVGGLFVLCTISPAHAADEVNIDHVESVDGKVSMVVAVDGIPGEATVDPASVRVEVDGRAVESSAKSIAAGDVTRTTVLVLDASNSMRQGGKFASATAAVDAFLAAAPDDVRIGLVPFAGDLGDVIEPTTDHASVRAALADITLRKGTGVYDAMAEGLAQVGTDGSRSLLVLSDGGDTNSSTTLDVVTKDSQDGGVVVDVVSLANPKNAETMSSLADGTGGQVIPAEQGALESVFSDQADALAQQLVVTFDRPEDVADEVNISVGLESGGTTYTDSAFVSIGTASSAPDRSARASHSSAPLACSPGPLHWRWASPASWQSPSQVPTSHRRIVGSMSTSERGAQASEGRTALQTSRDLRWRSLTRSCPPTSRHASPSDSLERGRL
jgi:tight adherence protein B